jgi:hypothetical protein
MLLISYKYTTTFEVNTYSLLVQMMLCNTNNDNTGPPADVQQSKTPPATAATTTRIQQDKYNTFVNYTSTTIRKTFPVLPCVNHHA